VCAFLVHKCIIGHPFSAVKCLLRKNSFYFSACFSVFFALEYKKRRLSTTNGQTEENLKEQASQKLKDSKI